MRRSSLNLVAVALLVAGTTCWGAADTASQSADPIGQQIDSVHDTRAGSTDATQIQQAIGTIQQQLQAADYHAVRAAVLGLTREGHWLKKLMDAGRYDEVANLTVAATLALPFDVSLVEYLQTYRVRALLKLGRPQEALAVAKGQFNVCRMKSTADSLLLLVDCLKAAYPGDAAIIDRLRSEQTAGAEMTQSSVISSQSSVLSSIKIDAAPYAAAIQRYTGTDYVSLFSLGNLLLLSDRAKEARPVFERAYAAASDKRLPAATESIARCMRAEDGTIGRANAWVLSIRPTAGR